MSAAHYRLPFDFRAAVTAIAGGVIARRRNEGEGRESEEKKSGRIGVLAQKYQQQSYGHVCVGDSR